MCGLLAHSIYCFVAVGKAPEIIYSYYSEDVGEPYAYLHIRLCERTHSGREEEYSAIAF